jgi:hypothetical protein
VRDRGVTLWREINSDEDGAHACKHCIRRTRWRAATDAISTTTSFTWSKPSHLERAVKQALEILSFT